jgi:hypothetical protein
MQGVGNISQGLSLSDASLWHKVSKIFQINQSNSFNRISIRYLADNMQSLSSTTTGNLSKDVSEADKNNIAYTYVDDLSLFKIPNDILPVCKEVAIGSSITLKLEISQAQKDIFSLSSRSAFWQWFRVSDGLILGSGTGAYSVNVSPLESTVYGLRIIIDGISQVLRDDIVVNVVSPAPVVLSAEPNPVCEGQNLFLSASILGNQVINNPRWIRPNETDPSLFGMSNYIISSNLDNGVFKFLYDFGSCNTFEEQISVAVLPSPNISITGSSYICSGSQLSLMAISTDVVSFMWSTGASTQSITVSNPGSYQVTATGSNGCTRTASKVVTEKVTIIPVLPPISICSGPNPCGILLPTSSGITSWSGEGVAYYNANTLPSSCPTQTAGYYFNVYSDALPTGLSPGLHTLHFNFTDQNGCSGVSSINALIRETPNLSFAINSEPFCPGKDLQFVLTEPALPGAQYIWAVDGVQESGTSINRLWTSEGTHQISLTVIPNNPIFCSNTVLRTIEVKRPSVKIFSKNYPSPITVCASVGSLELETVNVPGSIYDWQPASNITNTPQQNIVIAALNGLGNLPISVTISPYEGCSSATGQVTIISNQNQFIGSPGISYQFSESGPVSTANPIVTCSGNSIILTAGNGVTYTGSQPVIYRWLTPNNSLISGQTLTLENLAPGTYVYGVQVVENLEQGGCGSDFSNITIEVGNPGNLKLEPVSITGFPNDFRLKASFNSPNAEAFVLLREVDNVAVNLVANPLGTQLIDIYQHTPSVEPILMDGKYSVLVAYSGGCVARESFTVIGNKGIGTTEGNYQLSDFVSMGLTNSIGIIKATFSGKVFVHHNVNIENVKVSFDHADIHARGDVGEPVGIVCQSGYPCPGPVNGTNIRFRGSLCDVFVSNSQFHSVLDRMWGGFDVDGIERFQIGQSYATYNLGQIADQSTIADAYVGLKIGQTPLVKYCSLTDVRFENCFYGLIRDSHEEVTGTPTAHNSSVIVGCTVTCDPLEMKNPYHSRDNNDPYQQFITQAGMILRGNSRYPGYPQSLLTNYSFLNNVFDNCVTGLRVMNDGPAQGLDNITVSGCTFTRNMRSGIESNYGIGQVRKTDFQIPTKILSYFNVLAPPVNGVHHRPKAYGIIAYNGLDADQSTFSQFSQLQGYISGNTVEGILSETIGDLVISQPENIRITGNTFTNLGVAIRLTKRENSGAQPTSLNFTLKCNEFVNEPQAPTSTFTRKGLVIGNGVRVKAPNGLVSEPNAIGGDNSFNTTVNGPAYPNANVWPTLTPRNTPRVQLSGGGEGDLHDGGTGWVDSPKWISIENQTSNLVSYHRYDNEFVQNSQTSTPSLEYPQSPRKIIIGITNPNPNVYDLACSNFTDPLANLFAARVAVVSGLPENIVAGKIVFLSDPIPNPAKNETRIQINLPVRLEKPILQLMELGTGRVLQNVLLKELGQQEVLLNLYSVPSGVYSYRLLLDGVPVGTKKLVIFR